jgi:hypothetical protein
MDSGTPAGNSGTSTGNPGTPAGTDGWTKGPYAVSQLDGQGPVTQAGFAAEPQLTGMNNPTSGQGTVIYPTVLGMNGILSPIVAWGNGSGVQGPDAYRPVTEQIASYGIVVYNSFQSNDGSELKAGIDWLISENSRAGSIFEGKLDTTKIGVGGHSMGAICAFAVAQSDSRITTSVHLSGGAGYPIMLHGPTMFLCGQNTGTTDPLDAKGDLAAPACEKDFMSSTVPTFFAELQGVNHAGSFLFMNGAVAGWFTWQLLGDLNMKKMFVQPDCSLCTRMNWDVMTKNLN